MTSPGSRLLKLYNRSPFFVQDVLASSLGLKKLLVERGPAFRRVLQELLASQWWSRERLRELQIERLRKMLRFAQQHVPLYRKRFAEYGVSWNQVQSLEDLGKFPILTREDLRIHRRDLVPEVKSRSRIIAQSTSGSSGTPLEILCDHITYVTEKAWIARHRSWGGYDPRAWRATFNGHKIVPVNRKKPPFWRFNLPWRQIHFSIYHMSEEQLPLYINALRVNNVAFLDGYASAIYILARYLLATGQTLPMKAIFTGSEPLYATYRDAIETAFACKVYDYYGLTEKVVSAGECEQHSGFHVAMEHVVAEILPLDAKNAGQTDAVGELVGTSLTNTAMPFIRYRTGDVTYPCPPRCPCGRGLETIGEAKTKSMGIVVCPDGRHLAPIGVCFNIAYVHTVHEYQVIQKSLTDILIRVVRRSDYRQADEVRVLDGLREPLGPGMNVRIEYVDEIPRGAAGKYPLLVSEVSSDLLGPAYGQA